MSSVFGARASLKLSLAIVTTMLGFSPPLNVVLSRVFYLLAVGKDFRFMDKMNRDELPPESKLQAALQRCSNLWSLFRGDYVDLYAVRLHVSLSAWYNGKPPTYALRGSVSWYSPVGGRFLQVWANADDLALLLWELNRAMVKRARPDDYRARELEEHWRDPLVIAQADKWRAAAAAKRGVDPLAVYMRGFDPSEGDDDEAFAVL